MGTDLGARLAARLRTGLSAHCIGLELSAGEEAHGCRPGVGRKCPGQGLFSPHQTQMATVMPGVFDMPKKKTVDWRDHPS